MSGVLVGVSVMMVVVVVVQCVSHLEGVLVAVLGSRQLLQQVLHSVVCEAQHVQARHGATWAGLLQVGWHLGVHSHAGACRRHGIEHLLPHLRDVAGLNPEAVVGGELEDNVGLGGAGLGLVEEGGVI